MPTTATRSPGPRAAVAKTVERGDAGAHERRRIDGRKIVGHQRQRADGREHILGVAAIARDAGNLGGSLAGEEIAAAAVIAIAAESAVPADAHSLSGFPARDVGTNRIDHADHFVSGNARILDARKETVLRHRIAVADATSLDLDSHKAGAGLGNVAFDNFQGTARRGRLARRAFLALSSSTQVMRRSNDVEGFA